LSDFSKCEIAHCDFDTIIENLKEIKFSTSKNEDELQYLKENMETLDRKQEQLPFNINTLNLQFSSLSNKLWIVIDNSDIIQKQLNNLPSLSFFEDNIKFVIQSAEKFISNLADNDCFVRNFSQILELMIGFDSIYYLSINNLLTEIKNAFNNFPSLETVNSYFTEAPELSLNIP
jgi:hypothetical protein